MVSKVINMEVGNEGYEMDSQTIHMPLDISPSDFPYYLEVLSGADSADIVFNYGDDNKESLKKDHDDDVTVTSGADTGRIYKILLENLSKMKDSDDTAMGVFEAILNSSDFSGRPDRRTRNIEFARGLFDKIYPSIVHSIDQDISHS